MRENIGFMENKGNIGIMVSAGLWCPCIWLGLLFMHKWRIFWFKKKLLRCYWFLTVIDTFLWECYQSKFVCITRAGTGRNCHAYNIIQY